MKGLIRKETGIFVLLVVLCIAASLKNPLFLSGANLQNTARLVGMYGIFSIGMGMVIITGGIDLSIGSMFALLGVLLAIMLSEKHMSPIVAVLITLGTGTALGALHGFLITKVKLQPFIVTLCGFLLYRGLARYIAGDETKGFGDSKGFEGLKTFATGAPLGIPMPFIIMVVVAILMGVLLHGSVYGRHLYAAGRNEDAARYSGINSTRIISSSYIICGLLAGVAGILIAFFTNSISPSSHGNSYEMYGIAAAVLGGCSLRGGEGSIVGIVLGTILLQVLQNLVTLLNIPSSLNFAVMGTVILLGVLADQLLSRRGKRRAA